MPNNMIIVTDPFTAILLNGIANGTFNIWIFIAIFIGCPALAIGYCSLKERYIKYKRKKVYGSR